jgi:hypothetical protein
MCVSGEPLVLRHFLPGVQLLYSLSSVEHRSIINGDLDIDLIQVPHDGNDGITGIDAIAAEFFKRFPADEPTRVRNVVELKGWESESTSSLQMVSDKRIY